MRLSLTIFAGFIFWWHFLDLLRWLRCWFWRCGRCWSMCCRRRCWGSHYGCCIRRIAFDATLLISLRTLNVIQHFVANDCGQCMNTNAWTIFWFGCARQWVQESCNGHATPKMKTSCKKSDANGIKNSSASSKCVLFNFALLTNVTFPNLPMWWLKRIQTTKYEYVVNRTHFVNGSDIDSSYIVCNCVNAV